jgi:hypothetical protein
MPLLWVILATAVTLGILFALLSYSLFRFQRQIRQQFEQKFQDANQIIQEGRPPVTWTQRERQQIGTLQSRGESAAKVARVGERSKRRCLQQLRLLIRFLDNGRFYDSLETRQMMVERLAEIYEQWRQEPWERLINREIE